MTDTLDLGTFDPSQLRVAQAVATRLRDAGERGLIVGGAVRDAALGRRPKDVDMVSAATPEQVAELFERTIGVGQAFGIMVVLLEGEEVELATYRRDGDYSDGRRPDGVEYSTDYVEDAQRRDFTCNALYLDPLNGEVLDPVGGLADIRARRLNTVGEARRRFEEDGLRLLRMVRFEASLGFEPAPGLHEDARRASHNLASVSPERVLEELLRTFRLPGQLRSLETLLDCELLPRVMPADWEAWPERRRAAALLELAEADPVDGAAPFLALILDPSPLGPPPDLFAYGKEVEALAKQQLRPSSRLRQHLAACLRLRWELVKVLEHAPGDLVRRARLLRQPEASVALDLARAWAASGEQAGLTQALIEWGAWRREHLAQLSPEPLLDARAAMELGIPRGPQLGQFLRALEDRQLLAQFEGPFDLDAWVKDYLARTDPSGGREDAP